jgi:hypothetical protein
VSGPKRMKARHGVMLIPLPLPAFLDLATIIPASSLQRPAQQRRSAPLASRGLARSLAHAYILFPISARHQAVLLPDVSSTCLVLQAASDALLPGPSMASRLQPATSALAFNSRAQIGTSSLAIIAHTLTHQCKMVLGVEARSPSLAAPSCSQFIYALTLEPFELSLDRPPETLLDYLGRPAMVRPSFSYVVATWHNIYVTIGSP